MTRSNWHYGSAEGTAARVYEEAGMAAAEKLFGPTAVEGFDHTRISISGEGGTEQSRYKFFIDGFNCVAVGYGHADFKIERITRPKIEPRPETLTFFQRLKKAWLILFPPRRNRP